MKTTKITRPHLCNICGGSGINPKDRGQSTVPPNCIVCNGTGLLQIEEVEIVEGETMNEIKDDMNLTAAELRQEYYNVITTLSETAKERDAFKAEAASWREELIATTNREQKTSARADAAEAALVEAVVLTKREADGCVALISVRLDTKGAPSEYYEFWNRLRDKFLEVVRVHADRSEQDPDGPSDPDFSDMMTEVDTIAMKRPAPTPPRLCSARRSSG